MDLELFLKAASGSRKTLSLPKVFLDEWKLHKEFLYADHSYISYKLSELVLEPIYVQIPEVMKLAKMMFTARLSREQTQCMIDDAIDEENYGKAHLLKCLLDYDCSKPNILYSFDLTKYAKKEEDLIITSAIAINFRISAYTLEEWPIVLEMLPSICKLPITRQYEIVLENYTELILY